MNASGLVGENHPMIVISLVCSVSWGALVAFIFIIQLTMLIKVYRYRVSDM